MTCAYQESIVLSIELPVLLRVRDVMLDIIAQDMVRLDVITVDLVMGLHITDQPNVVEPIGQVVSHAPFHMEPGLLAHGETVPKMIVYTLTVQFVQLGNTIPRCATFLQRTQNARIAPGILTLTKSG